MSQPEKKYSPTEYDISVAKESLEPALERVNEMIKPRLAHIGRLLGEVKQGHYQCYEPGMTTLTDLAKELDQLTLIRRDMRMAFERL